MTNSTGCGSPTSAASDLPAPTAFSADLPLADTIAGLRRAMRRAARATDPANPLTVAQLELLSCLTQQPAIRPGQLARRLKLAPNSVTTLLNALHAREMITRSEVAGDARAVQVALTPDGYDAVARWSATNAAIVQAALATLSREDRHALSGALGALRELAQAIDDLAETPPHTTRTEEARKIGEVDQVTDTTAPR